MGPNNHTWRFYLESNNRWRWQKLALDGTVLKQSKAGYECYEDCLANAGRDGYVFLPSLTSRSPDTAPRVKRSYVRFPKPVKPAAPKKKA
jgi:hypothetical protein